MRYLEGVYSVRPFPGVPAFEALVQPLPPDGGDPKYRLISVKTLEFVEPVYERTLNGICREKGLHFVRKELEK